jgi:hypothetical protein
VPFFVVWLKGKPEFHMADAEKWVACVKFRLCWVCGQPLGRFAAFVIGPMCAINRVSSDPPSHQDCADWSVKGCPFMTKPQMLRREDELSEASRKNVAGILIERNPGVSMVWTTRSFKLFPDGAGKHLFNIGEPYAVTFWREGRPATRAEIDESVETGLPKLIDAVNMEKEKDRPSAMRELLAAKARMLQLLPAA